MKKMNRPNSNNMQIFQVGSHGWLSSCLKDDVVQNADIVLATTSAYDLTTGDH